MAGKRKISRKPLSHSTLLPALMRLRMISIREAAELRGISVDAFRDNFPHLIERVSPWRLAVQIGRLLDEPASERPPPAPRIKPNEKRCSDAA
jgi:hypothetical protein